MWKEHCNGKNFIFLLNRIRIHRCAKWMSLYVALVLRNRLMVHLAQLLIAVNNIRLTHYHSSSSECKQQAVGPIIICFTDGKTEFRPCLQVRFLARYSILTGYCLALCQWISDRMGRHPLCLLFSPSPLTQCLIILLSNGLKTLPVNKALYAEDHLRVTFREQKENCCCYKRS